MHIFTVNSRLGIVNFPHGKKESNEGVELAPEHIITGDFVKGIGKDVPVHSFVFSSLDIFFRDSHGFVDKDEYFSHLAGESSQLVSLMSGTSFPRIVVGGDHSVGFPSLIATLQHYAPKEVGVIMLDSHSDFCLCRESPSGNFHGMWLRGFFDDFDHPAIHALLASHCPGKIPGKNILFVGNLKDEPGYDEEEGVIMEKHGIHLIDREKIKGSRGLKELQAFIQDKKYLHVSIDIDVMHESIAPATGITGSWGLLDSEIEPLLSLLASSGKIIAIDMAEVNPYKQGAGKTIAYAQRMILMLLGKEK